MITIELKIKYDDTTLTEEVSDPDNDIDIVFEKAQDVLDEIKVWAEEEKKEEKVPF